MTPTDLERINRSMTLATVFGLSIFCSMLALLLTDVNAQITGSNSSTGFDTNTANGADIVLLSQRFNQEKFSDYIVGEVENNGTRAADFVQVSASFYDVNDEIVGREFTYTDPRTIAPETKSPFEIPIVSEAVQNEGVRYEFTLQWTNPDGSKEAKRMTDSFPLTSISVTTEPSQMPQQEPNVTKEPPTPISSDSKIQPRELAMQAIFEPKENRFSSQSKEYDMIGFGFDISPTKNQICPTGNCVYEFEDGELRENPISGGYTLEGSLKPIISERGSNRTNLYEVVGDLEVDESIKEEGGKLIDLIRGSFNIPEIGYYKVVNGSVTFQYEEGVLALQAEI